MIEFLPYKPEHIDRLKLRKEFEAKASIASTVNGPEYVKSMAKMGNALTIVDGEDILAIVTWYAPWEGLIDIGMFVSDEIYIRPHSYLRFTRKQFKIFLDSLNDGAVRRVQTLSFADEKHDKWMAWLGFKCEGTLKKYSRNGADMRIWAITEM